jgi:hypothetical protein
MKISITALRKIIKEEVERLYEDATPSPGNKPGTQSAKGTEGSVDVSRIAKATNSDPVTLKTAIQNLRSGKRTPKDDKVLGDLFAKLLKASPENTQVVMNVLKKVESEN